MIRNIFVCLQETDFNGQHYRPGDAWDEDGSTPPPYGAYWTIRRHVEVVVPEASASVRWARLPDRPRSTPPTEEELEIERADPYGLKARAREERETTSPAADDPDLGNFKFNEAARLRMIEINRLAAEDDARAAEEHEKEMVEETPIN